MLQKLTLGYTRASRTLLCTQQLTHLCKGCYCRRPVSLCQAAVGVNDKCAVCSFTQRRDQAQEPQKSSKARS